VGSGLVVLGQTPQWRYDRQVRNTLNRVINRTNTLQRQVARNRYPWDNNNTDERAATLVTAFSNALTSYRSALSGRRDATDEFEGVLERASRLNTFFDRRDMTASVKNQWQTIRKDVNTLAGYNNVSWNWNEPYRRDRGGIFNNTLTGTYRLNTSMSDSVATQIDRSLGYYNTNQRAGVKTRLERRLQSPEMIAIDRNGRTITMASSLQPQVTFDADGVARSETNNRGRTTTTTVRSTGTGFSVSTTGDRTNDFNVTFATDNSGRLRVTRSIYLENRNDQVTVTSVYDRIGNTADWTAVNSRYGTPYPGTTGTTSGNFYIPNGVVLTATLRNTVDTRNSQVGDRFTLDVVSPNQYRGAVIEGRIAEAERSGRFSGRAQLQMDFDTIRVNGRQYQFAGLIDSVRTVNGDTVTINNEGTIRDRSQTTQTATRAGIGALLGAIIGAVAGGGEGAAIGAGVGAGAGAGSVLIGGRDNIELGSGSSFTITSSAPAGTYSRN